MILSDKAWIFKNLCKSAWIKHLPWKINIIPSKADFTFNLTSMFKAGEIKYCHGQELTAYNLSESYMKHYSASQKKCDSNMLECFKDRVIHKSELRTFIKAKETEASSNFFWPQP